MKSTSYYTLTLNKDIFRFKKGKSEMGQSSMSQSTLDKGRRFSPAVQSLFDLPENYVECLLASIVSYNLDGRHVYA